MKTHTKEFQKKITPETALTALKEGNGRFVKTLQTKRNNLELVEETSSGQYPFGAVLSCIDSRVPVELVFDQGIGDIFSARVAGNIVNEDVLGSIEYACKVAGSKIVVVMGHTKCGAVAAACKHVELGNITALLNKIEPSVKAVNPNGTEMDTKAIEQVAVLNVKESMTKLRNESPILMEMEKNNEIKIVGAIYSVENGSVKFLT
jgi:carbonic anhydrase